MSTTSEAEFVNSYGNDVKRALGDIKAPPMDDETGDVLPGYHGQRAAADFHVPYTAADGGVYIPDQIVPRPTTAELDGALNLLGRVTRVPSATAKGHVARIDTAAVSELTYGATLPVSNLGDDTSMVSFSCRRYYSQQDADNIMLRGPGYARTIRDTLLYAARNFISVEIADGQASSFTGLAALTSDVEWGDASVNIGQLLSTIGDLDARWRNFPPDGLGWVMTQPTFYSDVLALEVTANKGSFVNVG